MNASVPPQENKIPEQNREISPGSQPVIDENAIFGAPGMGSAIEQQEDVIPPEVQALFELHGLSKKRYQCMLKQIPEGGERRKPVIVETYSRTFPTEAEIGKYHGSGDYELVFLFEGEDPDRPGKKKNFSETISMYISDSYDEIHEDYVLERQIKRAERRKKAIEKFKLNNALNLNLDGEDDKKKNVVESGKQYVREMMDVAGSLGLTQNRGIDWNALLPGIMTALPVLMKAFMDRADARRAENEKFWTMLMTMNNSNSQNLMDIMKNTVNPSPSKHFEDIMKMMVSAVDFKSAIEGNKESLVDKLFGTVERVAPIIGNMVMMSKAERERSMPYKMAQTYVNNDPDFQQLKNDKEGLIDFTNRLDSYFGQEQADLILQVGNMVRPPECPYMEVKQPGGQNVPPSPETGGQDASVTAQQGENNEREQTTDGNQYEEGTLVQDTPDG